MKSVLLVAVSIVLFSGCGSPNSNAPSSPSRGTQTKQKQMRSFEVSDLEGESNFQVQIDGIIVGTTPEGGVVEKSLELKPGEHTITVIRILGKVKKARFKVALDSLRTYALLPESNSALRTNCKVEFFYGYDYDQRRDELGYRVALGSLQVNHSVTLRVSVGQDD